MIQDLMRIIFKRFIKTEVKNLRHTVPRVTEHNRTDILTLTILCRNY